MTLTKPTRVYLEVAPKRTFAVALDWPGWGRSGKTAEDALAALARYADRYAAVVQGCGLRFDPALAADLTVVEQVDGDKTTEFGAPSVAVGADADPISQEDAERTGVLVQACWDALDKTVATSQKELQKGPRGGGRDRDKMLDHVISSEAMYARKIGVKHKSPAITDTAAIAAMRGDLLRVLGNASDGGLLVANGWRVAYAARRIAWHATDHTWEMEDRQP